MKRLLLFFISFTIALTVPLLCAAEAAKSSRQVTILQEVLILNSYHLGYAWSDDEQAAVIDVFRAKDKTWIPVIEYLDLKRLPDGRHLIELKKLFRLKYRNKKFSVVIAMDNPALEFAIDNQAELLGNAPIVFCGINNYTPSLVKGRSNVTGIAEAIDIAGTIEVMLRLHPDTREIFSPHDYTATGLAVRKELATLAPRFGKVRFRFTDPLTMGELLKEIERLPKDSLVLEIGFITDKSGRTFGLSEATNLFYKHSPVPIYSTYEQRLGFGIVGGKLISPRIHGRNAGRVALRILAGEKASAIPVVFESDSQPMFDYKVMSRFGIPLSALPENSTVINNPVPFYAAHREIILTALGIIGFLIVVISLLTINIIRITERKQAEKAKEESERRYRELFENASLGIFQSAPDGTVLIVNRRLARMFGYESPQEVYSTVKNVGTDFFADPHRREEIIRLKSENPDLDEFENLYRRKDGSTFWGSLHVRSALGLGGNIPYYEGFISDITKRKQAEEALRESEKRYRDLTDFLPISIFEVDARGSLISASRNALDVFRYNAEDFKEDMSVLQFISPEERQRAVEGIENVIQGTAIPGQEYTLLRKDGSTFTGLVYSAPYTRQNNAIAIRGAIVDITELKRAEEKIRNSEERLRDIIFSIADWVWEVDENGVYTYSSQKGFDLFGESRGDVIGKTPFDFMPPDEAKRVAAIFSEIAANKAPIKDLENWNIKRNGERVCLLTNGVPILDEEGNLKGYRGVDKDITERKQVEDALQKNRMDLIAIIDNLPFLAWMKDSEGRFLAVNEPFAHSCGLQSANDLIGKTDLDVWPKKLAEAYRADDSEVMRSRQKKAVEEPIADRGAEKWFETYKAPLFDVHGNVTGTTGFARDITDRKQVEDQIKASLLEKETMLKEIHHRVKNNLQVISGLLYLQARTTKNPELVESFRKSQDRIRAMALVHEKLYNAKDFSKIDLADYVRSLSEESFQSHSMNPGKIDLTIQTDGEVYVDIIKAIPCGLILNELISNALKHAFPGDKQGKLQIIISETKDSEMEIVVRDNGVGLPVDVDIHEPQSLGLDLVNGLVTNQLGGQIEVKRDNGTEFRITFPL